MQAEPVVADITAYRFFDAHPDGGLGSIGVAQNIWTPGMNEAICRRIGGWGGGFAGWKNGPNGQLVPHFENPYPNHGPVPSPDCTCGFWGYGTVDNLVNTLGLMQSLHSKRILATIQLWGRIVEGEKGYRAEYARILNLYRTGSVNKKLLKAAAKRYSVPVVDAQSATYPLHGRLYPISEAKLGETQVYMYGSGGHHLLSWEPLNLSSQHEQVWRVKPVRHNHRTQLWIVGPDGR